MFGKKKEENWEYIDSENYFDENEYGRIMTEDEKQEKAKKDNSSTEFLENLFRPHLMREEQLLCVIGSGKGDNENPFESNKNKKKMDKVDIAISIFTALFVIGCLVALFGNKKAAGWSFLMILPYMLLPLAAVFAVVYVLVWAIKVAPKSMNYAVTNKRVIAYGYKYFQSVRLVEITNVSVYMKNYNTGKITINAKGTGGYTIMSFPSVNDPYRVKSIIEKAKEDMISDLNNNSDCRQVQNVPPRPSTSYNSDVPLTMND